MSHEITSLESQLRALRPASPGPALLDRLEACAAGVWQNTSRTERAAGEALAGRQPAALPPALLESLHGVLDQVPFPQPSKIVAFPAKAGAPALRRHSRLAAVALVALCGVLTALLVPVSDKPDAVAANPPRPGAAPAAANKANLTPAGFRRGLSEASDEGVVWQSPHRAYRILRVDYQDTYTMPGSDGSIYQLEQPRVEYILVPAKID